MNPDSKSPEITGADARNNPSVSIIELSPDEWQILRDLKLRSLRQEPIAFDNVDEATEKWANRSEEEWRAILEGKMTGGREGESVNVFAKDEASENYRGMVSAIIPKGSNVATVQHMYVDNEGYRHKGIGKQLLQGLIDRIKTRNKIEKMKLQVVVTQEAAIGLYKSMGFKEVRRIENAVKRGSQQYDEFEMELEIKSDDYDQKTNL